MPYAENTTVSAEKSRAEIERVLDKYGASGYAYGWQDGGGVRTAVIQFQAAGRRIRFEVPMPSRDEERFLRTPARKTRRSSDAAYSAWEQECRRRWRAMALAVKAKLEVVESGIATFEQEFMAHVVMPDGRTVGEHVTPRIAEAYGTGRMPKLLPSVTGEVR